MQDSLTPEIASEPAKGKGLLNAAIRMIYPPLCISCAAETDTDSGLCPACWVETYFISGAICDCCSMPLVGDFDDDIVVCDGCTRQHPAWLRGRAALIYDGGGRRIALALKHGDRLDVAKPAAHWMVKAGHELLSAADVIVPVPLHWSRLLKRKFNQASILGQHIGALSGVPVVPDMLRRHKRTVMQVGMTREQRVKNQSGAISITPRHNDIITGKRVLLIDDVLTTGATLSACAEVCLTAGADNVNILVFARVARDE